MRALQTRTVKNSRGAGKFPRCWQLQLQAWLHSGWFLLDFPTDWTIDITAILLLAFIVSVVLIKGFRRRQKGHYQYDLFLHVGTDTSACEIRVKTFKLEPALYTFSATNYTESPEVTGTLFPRLILTWLTLRIHSDVTNESYCLPKTVAITRKQASFLRRIGAFLWLRRLMDSLCRLCLPEIGKLHRVTVRLIMPWVWQPWSRVPWHPHCILH